MAIVTVLLATIATAAGLVSLLIVVAVLVGMVVVCITGQPLTLQPPRWRTRRGR